MTRINIKVLAVLTITSLIIVFGVASSGDAASKEYPFTYKSPRAMGMGGANVAVGGTVDSMFYNPAGLGKMPEKNWEVNLLGISGEIGKDSIDFANDMTDAFDVGDVDGDGEESDDQLIAVNDVLRQYRGKNIHMAMSELTSIGRNFGKVAFGVGALGSADMNAIPHQGTGTDGLLEVHANARYGGIGGLSYKMTDGLYMGAAVKYIGSEALDHSFTVREIVENQDTLDDYITEDLRESGSGVGADAGVIYEFWRDSWLRPAVGLSMLNIGDLDLGDAGEIPMTANLGVAANPKVPVINSMVVGIDYVDFMNNIELDSDVAKRLRMGVEAKLFDKSFIEMALRAGLYQGYATAGVDLRLTVVKISYVTYAEELGSYAGQDKDRRHLVMLNIGW